MLNFNVDSVGHCVRIQNYSMLYCSLNEGWCEEHEDPKVASSLPFGDIKHGVMAAALAALHNAVPLALFIPIILS